MFLEHTPWRWGTLTRDDAADRVDDIVLVPVGSTEQHGRHLPTTTDTLLAMYIADVVAGLDAVGRQVVVTPPLFFGYSPHHFPYTGTLSLTHQTLMGILLDLGESLRRTGFRRIWLLTGHGGNQEAIRIASRELALNSGLTVGACGYWEPALSSLLQLPTLRGRPVPGHAGFFETALMLAAHPNLVHPAGDLDSRKVSHFADPYIQAPGGFSVFDGFTDDPGPATAEDGHRFLAEISRSLGMVLGAFHSL